MLVAITGASGFVGSYAVQSLKHLGHEVRALVRNQSRRDHIAPYVKRFVEADQSDVPAMEALVAGADAVIHNSVDWTARQRSNDDNFSRNLLASLQLLERARLANVKQFVFVSSVAVYNEILPDRALDENHPTWPSGMYGAYKAAVESHLKAYHVSQGMNTSAWRPAAIYGVDPKRDRSQWFDLIQQARNGERISNDKGGKITHVQDVADALALSIGDASVAGEFYNLVDGYMYWQTAAEIAKELSGSKAPIDDRKGKGPKNQFDTRKAIAFFDRHGNTTALRRGEQGVREYVQSIISPST